MEIFENYVREIQRYKLLSLKEEEELSKKIQSGSKAALNQLVQANLRLVVSIAMKFVVSHKFSIMDLIQEGNLGLMAAAEKYHYSFNTKFSTYAYAWIFQYMVRFIQSKTQLIGLPQRRIEQQKRIEQATILFAQEKGRQPSMMELAEYMSVPEDELFEIFASSISISSLDIECGTKGRDEGTTIGDLIPDSKYNPERVFFEELEKASVNELLNKLPVKEKIVIRSRYNFDRSQKAITLRELSQSLGVSAETVRQMEIRAVRKLKKITECAG